MKIRVGFVTNSSSYGSADIRIDNPVLYEILKRYKDQGVFDVRSIEDDDTLQEALAPSPGRALEFSESDDSNFKNYHPEKLRDIFDCFMDFFRGVYYSWNEESQAAFELLEELEARRPEIESNYVYVSWSSANYDFQARNPGDVFECNFEYDRKNGYVDSEIYIQADEIEHSRNTGNYKTRSKRSKVLTNISPSRVLLEEEALWFEEYGPYMTLEPNIDYDGRIFVFSGFRDYDYSVRSLRKLNVVKLVQEMGGVFRSGVSGLTDYLVINPGDTGITKITAAIDQKSKGRSLEIIYLNDLLIDLEKHSKNVLIPPTPDKIESPKSEQTEKNSDNHKRGALDTSKVNDVLHAIDEDISDQANDNILYTGFASAKKPFMLKNIQMAADEDLVIKDNILIKYLGKGTDIELPGGITSISFTAFKECNSLTSIIIPEGVLSIEKEAFAECKNLITVILPSTLEYLETATFRNCSSLVSISLPEGIEIIPEETFKGCSNLKLVDIPASIITIGASAFADCGSLHKLQLPSKLKFIDSAAFRNCSSLTSVEIPKSVMLINSNAFRGCTNLRSAIVNAAVAKMRHACFADCDELSDVSLPPGLRDMCLNTFSYCKKLETIAIPDTVSEISSAFTSCYGLRTIVIPEGVTHIYSQAFKDCINLKSVTIPSSVKRKWDIDFGAFENTSEELMLNFNEWNEAVLFAVENGYRYSVSGEVISEQGGRTEEVLTEDEINQKRYESRCKRYVDSKPKIEYKGKRIFFSRLSLIPYEKYIDLDVVKRIQKKGGACQKDLSGLTDYLVIDPTRENNDILDTAIEYKAKGRPIKIILFEDLLTDLGEISDIPKPSRDKRAEANQREHPSDYQEKIDSRKLREELGSYIEADPDIDIFEKVFVFAGLDTQNEMVYKIMAQGGWFRSQISEETDYFVVDPLTVKDTELKVAMDLKKAGKPITFIQLKDFESLLEKKEMELSNKLPSDEAPNNQDKSDSELWLEEYGLHVETNPQIEFEGKLFVFTGLTKSHEAAKQVMAKGGEYRSGISGKIDYLIVNPVCLAE